MTNPLKLLGFFFVGVILCFVLFYAVVGVACLHMTAPAITNGSRECDRVKTYEDGSVVCEVIMRGADDNITSVYVAPELLPLSEPNDPDDIVTTYNPQETVTESEIQ